MYFVHVYCFCIICVCWYYCIFIGIVPLYCLYNTAPMHILHYLCMAVCILSLFSLFESFPLYVSVNILPLSTVNKFPLHRQYYRCKTPLNRRSGETPQKVEEIKFTLAMQSYSYSYSGLETSYWDSDGQRLSRVSPFTPEPILRIFGVNRKR